MNTYLLSYTINDKYLKNSEFRNQFKEYIEEYINQWLFETTYLIKSELTYEELCKQFRFKFRELKHEYDIENKAKYKLAIFDIYDFCHINLPEAKEFFNS